MDESFNIFRVLQYIVYNRISMISNIDDDIQFFISKCLLDTPF